VSAGASQPGGTGFQYAAVNSLLVGRPRPSPEQDQHLPGGNAGEVSGCVPAAGIPDLGLSEQYAIDA
jgi:hypothetical protein